MMKTSYIATALLSYVSITLATPILFQRDPPAEPAGSVLPTPAELLRVSAPDGSNRRSTRPESVQTEAIHTVDS